MEQQAVEQKPQELSNDEVRVIVHRRPHCRIELEVHAAAPIVKAAYKKAVKAVSKEVSLPGFRKGKVPDSLVIKNFSEHVDRQWQEEIANEAFKAAQKLVNIPLLNGNSKITFQTASHSESGAKLSLFFETEPEIPSIDTQKIQLTPVPRPEITEERVQEMTRQIQLFFATWNHVTDRPVQEGDFVLLDVELAEDAAPLYTNTRFEVKPKSMAHWMLQIVLNQPTGATVEGLSAPEPDATEEEKKAYPPRKVRIHIKAIEQPTAPPLDDAFAAMLGVKTMDEVKNAVTIMLTNQADKSVQEALREQINEHILSQYQFDLPSSLIEKETHFRMKQLLSDPGFQQQWNAMKNDERKNTVESVSQQSQKAVRMFYICRKIVQDAKISVSPKDLPEPPKTLLEVMLNPHQDNYGADHSSEIKQAEAFSRILLEKAQDYLIAHAPK